MQMIWVQVGYDAAILLPVGAMEHLKDAVLVKPENYEHKAWMKNGEQTMFMKFFDTDALVTPEVAS